MFLFSMCGWSAVNILPAVLKDEKKLVQVHAAVTHVESPYKAVVYYMPSCTTVIELSAAFCCLQQCPDVAFCCD